MHARTIQDTTADESIYNNYKIYLNLLTTLQHSVVAIIKESEL